jgi:hypothetical protein
MRAKKSWLVAPEMPKFLILNSFSRFSASASFFSYSEIWSSMNCRACWESWRLLEVFDSTNISTSEFTTRRARTGSRSL